MSFTLPKPLIPGLVKARVPVWVIAAAIAAQIVVTQVNQNHEPSCSIKFERIHYSSSIKRNLGKDSIKLNPVTSCNQSQNYSDIVANISVLKNDRPVRIYTSVNTRQKASAKKPTDAEFLEFWVSCKKDSVESYRGEATGKVVLSTGKIVSVSSDTGKFLSVLCNFRAK